MINLIEKINEMAKAEAQQFVAGTLSPGDYFVSIQKILRDANEVSRLLAKYAPTPR